MCLIYNPATKANTVCSRAILIKRNLQAQYIMSDYMVCILHSLLYFQCIFIPPGWGHCLFLSRSAGTPGVCGSLHLYSLNPPNEPRITPSGPAGLYLLLMLFLSSELLQNLSESVHTVKPSLGRRQGDTATVKFLRFPRLPLQQKGKGETISHPSFKAHFLCRRRTTLDAMLIVVGDHC